MAVYTKVTKNNLNNFLMNYDIGILKNFEEIAEGVENTNYKITTSKNIFILTIFEKRVSIKDLPFFMELMNYLNNKKYKCPKPIANLEGKFKNKTFMLTGKFEGMSRAEAKSLIEKHSGKILSTVSNKLNYLMKIKLN